VGAKGEQTRELTLTVSKRLTKDVSVAVTYALDHQGGTGYNSNYPAIPLYEGSSGAPLVLPSPGGGHDKDRGIVHRGLVFDLPAVYWQTAWPR
jgi:hypothetical protein